MTTNNKLFTRHASLVTVFASLTTVFQDIQFAIRMFTKNWVTTLLAVSALAIGIGANSAIFSMINSVLVSSMPYPEMNQLMRVCAVPQGSNSEDDSISGPNYLDIKEQCKSFQSCSLVTNGYFSLAGGQGEPVRLPAYMMSSDFIQMLGFSMPLGRSFIPEEGEEGKNHVVLLTNGIWKERFGSDRDIVGKTISIDSDAYTVIGVLPSNLGFLEGEAKIWLPLSNEQIRKNRGDRSYSSIARLKQGITVEQAQAELKPIARRLIEQYTDVNAKFDIQIEPLMYRVIRSMKQTFIVLHGTVGFVLLIACSIVASLLLARANSRQKEIAIRSALGASRIRIVRQVLTESILLSIMGGIAGLLIALWGIDALGTLLPPSQSLFLFRTGVDANVMIFTLLICLVTGVLFGLVPAFQVSRTNLRGTLNEGGRGSGVRSGGHRLLRILVVSEIALSLVLLIGAGLMVASFGRLQKVEPGFKTDHLMTCNVFLPDVKYKEIDKKRAYYRDVVQRIQSIPGHQGIAVSSVLPMTWDEGAFYEVEGKTPVSKEEKKFAQTRSISPSYFQVMDIPLLKGRFLTEEDENETNTKIVINERLARELKGDPISQLIRLPEWGEKAYEVVGVVGNMKQFGLKSEYSPEIYTTFLHRPGMNICFAMRTPGDPHRFASLIRQEIRSLDASLPVNKIRTMDELIGETMVMERFGTILMSLFSIMALILSSLGIYGIMAYSTSQRTHEIGVRIAIGAQMGDVVKLVVKQGLRLTLTGIGIGLAGSFCITRFLSGSLYGISATDPVTFIYISFFLIVVSLLACYIPARKAAKVDPIIALRWE